MKFIKIPMPKYLNYIYIYIYYSYIQIGFIQLYYHIARNLGIY